VRVVIAGDDPLGQRDLRARLAATPDMDIVAACATGGDTVAMIHELSPDLVFLDMQMPDMSGVDVLRRLKVRQMPLVIFVTAPDDFAPQAFEVQAVDYLLKPIDDGRFAAAVERARLLSRSSDVLAFEHRVRALLEHFHTGSQRRYRLRMIAKARRRIRVVPVSEIDWIGAAGDYVALHVGTKAHLVRQTITSIERELDPEVFIRVHRSTIVQAARISELVPVGNGECLVRLKDGTELRTSRSYGQKLEKSL
jgi:two-component system LytT family response regulator